MVLLEGGADVVFGGAAVPVAHRDGEGGCGEQENTENLHIYSVCVLVDRGGREAAFISFDGDTCAVHNLLNLLCCFIDVCLYSIV